MGQVLSRQPSEDRAVELLNKIQTSAKRPNIWIHAPPPHIGGTHDLWDYLRDQREGFELQDGHLFPLWPLSAFQARMIARVCGLISRCLKEIDGPHRLGVSVTARPYAENTCLIVDLAVTTDPDWFHTTQPPLVLAIEVLSGEPGEDSMAIGRRLLHVSSLKEFVVLHADLPLAAFWRTGTRHSMLGGPADHPEFGTGILNLSSIGLDLDIGSIYRSERAGAPI
ncbi:hypothetical protein SAE02_61200 [Skermanella aerolata]|uniref:Restriction endonuclease domain-containing protein n=1 Tax=Skermanella aerolata TaxID=393310 RepID=A0A512DZU7_9PROT|nr:hypothetical protein [Skermanella aerolata]KJB91925.1 hypothetical protein N826_25750 [Skermanella aerolata KACC 11604]GEO41972.1 hypothetical protein SAE02_61200 [Skermanella aerolata]